MTMDRSLKSHAGLKGKRSVMTRSERIAHMIEEDKFDLEKDSPFGLPKLRVQRSKAGTKHKKEDAAEETVEEGADVAATDDAGDDAEA